MGELTKKQKFGLGLVTVVAIILIGMWASGSFDGGQKSGYIGGYLRKNVEYQYLTGHAPPKKMSDHFMSDAYHWPGSGNFGHYADTNPHGNYAGHQDLWYPVYNQMAEWSPIFDRVAD